MTVFDPWNLLRETSAGPDLFFGYPDSLLFLGRRTAPDEKGRPVSQIFVDLPRREPRTSGPQEQELPGLFFLRPFIPDESFPDADLSSLRLCFDTPSCIRLRCRGAGLRVYAPLLDHEAAVDRQDGTYQVCFEASCEVLFLPLRGCAETDNPWSLWNGGTCRLLLTVLPDDDGVSELAIHVTPTGTERFPSYRPFEQCLEESRREYAAFLREHGLESSPEAYRRWVCLPARPGPEQRTDAGRPAWQRLEERLLQTPLYPKAPGPHLLSSTEAFDLRAVPFSRRGSFLCVLEDDRDRSLYLSVTRSPGMWARRLNLVRLTPCLDGQPLPMEYDVSVSCLTVRTCAGPIRFAFDGAGRLHIRGSGASLKLSFRLLRGENCLPADPDRGAWDVSFLVQGHLLSVPAEGRLLCDAGWQEECGSPGVFSMYCLPSAPRGDFRLVLENSCDPVPLQPSYPSFETCIRDAEQDFAAFRRRFPALPEKYASRAPLAAWVIWTHSLGPSGDLLHPVQYMTRTQWIRAFSWQQSFHAMAARSDPAAAWQLLLTIFDYLSPAGQLPDSVGDIGRTYRVTKPALQGLALLYLTDRCDFSSVPRDQVEDLYRKMSAFARWWMTCRDRCGGGLPQYFHADESPGEFCSVFRMGVPLYSADAASFVALLAEACSRLAARLDLPGEESRWMDVSEGIVSRMLERLWDGERFQARLVKTDEIVPSRCVLAMLPVMLGDRLPPEVLDSLLSRLSSEQEYLTPHGITLEHVSEHKGDGLPQGTVAYIGALFSAALSRIGQADLSREIARRCADHLLETGFGFLTAAGPQDPPPADPDLPRAKSPAPVSRWTSWTCACYILLADLARE